MHGGDFYQWNTELCLFSDCALVNFPKLSRKSFFCICMQKILISWKASKQRNQNRIWKECSAAWKQTINDVSISSTHGFELIFNKAICAHDLVFATVLPICTSLHRQFMVFSLLNIFPNKVKC